jgi:hypothetical protein
MHGAEKLIVARMVKKFPVFHANQGFITVFTKSSILSQLNAAHSFIPKDF